MSRLKKLISIILTVCVALFGAMSFVACDDIDIVKGADKYYLYNTRLDEHVLSEYLELDGTKCRFVKSSDGVTVTSSGTANFDGQLFTITCDGEVLGVPVTTVMRGEREKTGVLRIDSRTSIGLSTTPVTETDVQYYCMKNCSPDDPVGQSLRITFDANGGRFSSGADSVKVKTDADGCVELPVAPERNGHYFDGYFLSRSGGGTQVTSETVFDRSTTVYAQWTKAPASSKRYYLYDPRTDKFDKTEYMDINGDNCTMTDGTIILSGTVRINGNKITVELQTEVLDGLFMKTELGGIVESNGVIYFNAMKIEDGEEQAVYDYYCPDGVKPINPVIPELQPAVVTFDANGGKFSDGSSQKKITADKDGKVVFPENPTKAGYEFEGFAYYSFGSVISKDTVFDFGNVTLYAQYAKYYTVTFKVGTKTVETRKVAEGKQLGAYDIPAPTGEENAIMFKGWKGNRNSYEYYTPTSRIDNYLTLTAEFYTQQDFQSYMNFMKYWQKPGHFYIHYRNKYDEPRDVDLDVTRNYLKNTVYEDWLLWAWQKNGAGRAFEPIHIGMFGIVFDIDMRTTYYDGGWDAVNKTDKGESLTFYRKDFGIMFFDDKSRYDGAYWKQDGEQLNLLYEMFIFGDVDDEGNIIGNESYAFDESISLNTLFLAGEISQSDVDNGMMFFTGYYS